MATSLQPYVKEVANQKALNIQALQDVYGIEVGNSCKPKRQEVVNGCQPKNEEKAYHEERIRELMEHLKKEVEHLHEDLQIEKKSNLLLLAQKNEEIAVLEDQKKEPWWKKWFK